MSLCEVHFSFLFPANYIRAINKMVERRKIFFFHLLLANQKKERNANRNFEKVN